MRWHSTSVFFVFKAFRGEKFQFPYIGEIAQKQADAV